MQTAILTLLNIMLNFVEYAFYLLLFAGFVYCFIKREQSEP